MEAIGWAAFLLLAFLVVALFMLMFGMHLGMQLAVDQTKKYGCFWAYGKSYVAAEAPAPTDARQA